jgi:hypothetical protein
MKKNRISKIIGASVITILLVSTISVLGINVKNNETLGSEPSYPITAYGGQLRVYIVEPVSRWDDYDGNPYHYGFLDLAIDEKLSIEFNDSYNKQVTWNAQQAGYDNVEENNIMVIAAIFNPEGKIKYSYPPNSYPFIAHFVDAAAAATPGTTGENTVTENFTHTVFVEEGTGTWCKYCPIASENLYTIFNTSDYPFYFVALIEDMAQKAEDRLEDDYNIFGYPTCYFDGGYEVGFGAGDVPTFRDYIESSGSRDVHEFDLSISLVWAGSGVLDIDVTITNNEKTSAQNQEVNSFPTRAKSNPTTFQITTSSSKSWLLGFFDHFPNSYPILRQLLGL